MELKVKQDDFYLLQTFQIVLPSQGVLHIDISDIPTGKEEPKTDYLGIDLTFKNQENVGTGINVTSATISESEHPLRTVVELINFNNSFGLASLEPLNIATVEGNPKRKLYMQLFARRELKILTVSLFYKDEE